MSEIRYDVDERVLKLAGDAAPLLTSGERTYLDGLDEVQIQGAVESGTLCVIRLRGMRVFAYECGDEVCAIVMQLAHGGYRRRFKKLTAETVSEVIRQLPSTA